jgi:site-specific DNA-cytosine methylase
VDGKPGDNGRHLRIDEWEQDAPTLTATQDKHPFRAVLERCRVVSMTPRCLARFQTLPDWYKLPTSKKLAGTIIGNGVPVLLIQRCLESLESE